MNPDPDPFHGDERWEPARPGVPVAVLAWVVAAVLGLGAVLLLVAVAS